MDTKNDPTARLRYYRFLMAYLWALTAGVFALWIGYGRRWNDILLGVPSGWHLAAALVAVGANLLLLPLMAQQTQLVQQRPELARRHLVALDALLPHTPRERAVWTYVAVAAGVCEEVVFRGFLLRFVAYFTGLAVAVVVSAVLFGLAHAYQGRVGMVKTAAVGFVLTLVALGSASLVPGMIAHFVIDLVSGDVGYRVLAPGARAVYEPSA